MHPLTDFPQLFSYTFFVPTLLRVAAAFVFGGVAKTQWRARTENQALLAPLLGTLSRSALTLLVAVEYAIAIALLVGWHTQIAAAVGVILALKYIFVRPRSFSPLSSTAKWLLLVICLSLVVLGAGALALDIHL